MKFYSAYTCLYFADFAGKIIGILLFLAFYAQYSVYFGKISLIFEDTFSREQKKFYFVNPMLVHLGHFLNMLVH